MNKSLKLLITLLFILLTLSCDLFALDNASLLERIKGRWKRTDSNYLIAIEDIATNGNLKALYFNPQSINVSEANVTQDGENIKIMIELRDVNYPGSNYNLLYDAAQDRLVGTYYQAVTKETFQVSFIRAKT